LNIINYDKLFKDLEEKPESVLTYKSVTKDTEKDKNDETRIKPEERFEDVTDWEAFDNLAKLHGIPTLADLGKGENCSAYLIETDYIAEPEPHPYQEILSKGNFIKPREVIPQKVEKEITKSDFKTAEIIEKEITKNKFTTTEIDKKEITEKNTSANKNITKEEIYKRIPKQNDLTFIEIKKQDLDQWKMKKIKSQ